MNQLSFNVWRAGHHDNISAAYLQIACTWTHTMNRRTVEGLFTSEQTCKNAVIDQRRMKKSEFMFPRGNN